MALCLALGGCYAFRPSDMHMEHWTSPTASYADFAKDKAQCLTEAVNRHKAAAQGAAPPANPRDDWDLYLACMEAHGYQRDDQGKLS